MDVEQLEKLGQSIQSALSGSVSGYEIVRGELTVHAEGRRHRRGRDFLRDDHAPASSSASSTSPRSTGRAANGASTSSIISCRRG